MAEGGLFELVKATVCGAVLKQLARIWALSMAPLAVPQALEEERCRGVEGKKAL
jgi:hypothetical protein